LNKGRGHLVWLLCLGALVLAFVGGQVSPVTYLMVGVLAPLPVLLVGRRCGTMAALGLALAAALTIFSLRPSLETITAHLGFGQLLLLGVLLSWLQRRLYPPKAIILAVVVINLVTLLYVTGEALYLGVTLPALLAQKSREVMDSFQKFVEGAGSGSEGLALPGFTLEEVRRLLQFMLPGLVVVNSAMVAWINVVLARRLAPALGWGEPEQPMYYWAVPEWLIFIALAAGFLLLMPAKAVRLLSLNLLMVLALLYFFQGVAVLSAWFHRFNLPRFVRAVGYPLMFFHPLVFLVIILGLLDLWFDFRRLHQPKQA